MIICIVGPSCAGKSTSAEYVESKIDGQHYEASDFVKRRYTECQFDGPIMDFVKREFNEEGKDTFAQPICEEINNSSTTHAIISGFRTEDEIQLIQDIFDSTYVCGVFANSLLRYQRKLRRDNPDSEYTYDAFLRKDFTEYSFGIVQALDQQLDSLIINEGTFEDLYRTIDDVILSVDSISLQETRVD